MRQESSEVLIEVIRIIPSLFWQIIILIALFIYKKEIILFLKKIKKGSFFGNDFELSNDIDKLETKVEKIKENTPINSEIFGKNNSDGGINFDGDRKMVLIQIAIEIEKEIKKIMLSTGWSNNQNVISVKQSFLFLIKNGALPNNLSSSIDIFLDIRNKIIHSHGMVSDDEILRMVDLGLSLLKSIRAIPHEINKVYKKDIDLYTDNELKNKIDNARGLLLETTSAGEAIKTFRIFPTTKDSYIEGKMVSWEWSFDNQWGETYYKHPISKKIELAWNSSAEFIGRILD